VNGWRVLISLLTVAFTAATLLFAAQPVLAESVTPHTLASDYEPGDEDAFHELWSLLKLDEMIEIMREEGINIAISSDQDLLGRAGGQQWADRVAAIYNVGQLKPAVEQALTQSLDPTHLARLRDFYSRADIQNVVVLELSTREAFLDPEIEERARSAWLSQTALAPHEEAISRFIEMNDLIERNVMGALNSNYAFFSAMSEANSDVSTRLTDQDILSEVWAQEEIIRQDTSEWLFAYLSMAYKPLDAQVLQDYIDFSDTAPGRALNTALFEAFDQMYLGLSRELGKAVGELGAQQEL